ncbi:hypothetical protein LSTR_LSTR016071 [Laodelphax striatellus]|uniref:Uncharacterized protein n=1 Tax=Laodelphax striatellus TaxID=195883 RepID=A0A482XCE0_LAOST|nr:hypothetical protein LSTR_LSTR016071 [Laodelphax striatellus]
MFNLNQANNPPSGQTNGKIKRSVDEQRWDEIDASVIDGQSNEMITEDVGNSLDEDKNSGCKLRFQQSPVEVNSNPVYVA